MTRECDCPYHYDDFGCQGPGECPNEGTIRVPLGWLCPECYDEIDAALAGAGVPSGAPPRQ